MKNSLLEVYWITGGLLDKLIALKYPDIHFDPDALKLEDMIESSRLFFNAPPKGIECKTRFYGIKDGLTFDISQFYRLPDLQNGTYANIQGVKHIEPMVYIAKRSTKLVEGLGSALKSLPGVQKMLPDLPELHGIIPELEEHYFIFSESKEAVLEAFTPKRTKALIELAINRSKLIAVNLTFIGNQVHLYDGEQEFLHITPSVKHPLVGSSPEVVFKGLFEKIELLEQLV